eukprot:GHVU01070492.1.p3 GENE.GHVU01070492.1~~GHVU01070492.1.p3  ORF type:complete len:124 (-),score=8.20 GHVU01070492.1:88-459(-)
MTIIYAPVRSLWRVEPSKAIRTRMYECRMHGTDLFFLLWGKHARQGWMDCASPTADRSVLFRLADEETHSLSAVQRGARAVVDRSATKRGTGSAVAAESSSTEPPAQEWIAKQLTFKRRPSAE